MYIISNDNGKYDVRNCSPFRFQQKTNMSTLCSHLPNSHVNLAKIFCEFKPVNPVTQQSIWAAGGWNKEKAKHSNNQFYKCFAAVQQNFMCKMQHSNNKYNKWTIIYRYSFDLRALSGVKNDVDIDNTIFLTQQATSLICNGSATHILMEWNRSSCVSCS